MVKHIILWKLKSDVSDPVSAKAEAKSRLESLVGKIPGLHSLIVQTEGLSSSSADMMLDSTLEDEAALAVYQNHPLHLEAAGFVRSVVDVRLCLDFEI
jgi:hypothetical protein